MHYPWRARLPLLIINAADRRSVVAMGVHLRRRIQPIDATH